MQLVLIVSLHHSMSDRWRKMDREKIGIFIRATLIAKRSRFLSVNLFRTHGGREIAVSAVCDGGDQGCGGGLLLLQAMKRLEAGAVLEVRSTDPGVREDLPAWCRMTGNTLRQVLPDACGHQFLLEKGANQPMSTLLQNFLAAGGSLWVCSPCMAKELLIRALRGERVAPIPWLPHIGTHAAQLLGVSA